MAKRLLAVLLLLTACDLPRDPEHTLETVEVSGMRVGVAPRAPWTAAGEEPSGVEADLVRAFARDLGTEVHWETGSEADILESIELGNLDLAIGGFTADNPWASRVSFIQPYYVLGDEQHVMAVPHGENAWIVRLERFLRSRLGEIPELLEEHTSA